MRAAARWSLWATGAAAILAYDAAVPATFTLPKLAALALGLTVSALLLTAAGDAPAGPAALAKPAAALALALAVSTIFSIDPRLSLAGRYDSWAHGVWALALYGALAWTAARAFAGAEGATAAVFCVLAAVLSADALAQQRDLDPFIRKAVLPLGRSVGTLGSPVDLGGALTVLFPFTLWAARRKPLAWPAVLLAAGGLWATRSRGAWLASGVGLISFWALDGAPGPLARLPSRGRGAAAVAAILAAVVAVGLAFQPKRDRARLEVWKVAGRAFLEHPIVGSGPDTFERDFRRLHSEGFVRAMRSSTAQQAYAHNDVLQALATTGLVGAAAYLWLWVAVGFYARGAFQGPARGPAAAAAAGLAGLWLLLKFDPVSLEVTALAALAAGLLLASRAPKPAPGGERWTCAATAGLGVASLVVVVTLWGAERSEHFAQDLAKRQSWSAAVDAHRRALERTPCEVTYATNLVNDLGPAINATRVVSERIQLLDHGLAAGQGAVSCHPSDVTAHYVLANAHVFYAQLGMVDHLPRAAEEADAALRLDPLFEPLLRFRLQIAAMAGNKKTAGELETRLARLAALTSG